MFAPEKILGWIAVPPARTKISLALSLRGSTAEGRSWESRCDPVPPLANGGFRKVKMLVRVCKGRSRTK
jgi:hypothetical protein